MSKIKMDFFERIMLVEGCRIPVFGGIWYRLLSMRMRKKVKTIKTESLFLNKSNRKVKLVCTLTTFPDRIDSVQYTIKTLFQQSMRPDRIVLWLAEEEFPDKQLPQSVLDLQKQGLEVRYCNNLFGHKRYYKLIEEQKADECIVLFDDDILFPKYLLERLYRKWEQHTNCIVCERGQVVTIKEGKIVNPGRWSSTSNVGVDDPVFCLLASPGGGCLIPPNALYRDVNNTELITKYALKTGDIWLMFMAVQNDTKIIRTHKNHRIFILSEKTQTVQLGKEAIYQGRYEKTFSELAALYPHAYENMLKSLQEQKTSK